MASETTSRIIENRGAARVVGDLAEAAIDQVGYEQDLPLPKHHRHHEGADAEGVRNQKGRKYAAYAERDGYREMRLPTCSAERLGGLDEARIHVLK